MAGFMHGRERHLPPLRPTGREMCELCQRGAAHIKHRIGTRLINQIKLRVCWLRVLLVGGCGVFWWVGCNQLFSFTNSHLRIMNIFCGVVV